jgi:dolichyl-phosphate-mannose-protein mannosyltransferase
LDKAPAPPAQQDEAQKPLNPPNGAEGAAGISGAPQFNMEGQKVIGREERVEYRDQDGNLLNEEQVKELSAAGTIEFKTRYETRTRVVDSEGREIPGAEIPIAPPHPDVEGVDSSTKQKVPKADESIPDAEKAKVVKSRDGEKEKEKEKPKPASEGNEATKKA